MKLNARKYQFKKKEKAELVPKLFKPSSEAIKHLADYIYEGYMRDGSAAYEAIEFLKETEMIDVLKEEFEKFPNSPVSIELRRFLRKKSYEEAARVAEEILVSSIEN